MGALDGRRALVTGGSRGIGRAICLELAAAGAKVVVNYNTTPAGADEVVAAIQEGGSEAVSLKADVSVPDEAAALVKGAVDAFGGLDILVNNASAISLTSTLETPIKRFDLMHDVNTRGTFLCVQKCLPHLMRSSNAHVLMLAPPLTLDPRWFAPHVAYSLAKIGMSLCVLGMAEEFATDGVAVNALWPKTAIDTAAIGLVAPAMQRYCRSADIVADAAHAILTRNSRECTGRFFIDEAVLREEGVTDFSRYRHPEVQEEELMPDFFV